MLRRFWFSRQPRVEPLLEIPAEILAGDGGREAGPAGLEAHDRHGRHRAPVAAGVALGFRQRPKPNHKLERTSRSGRQDAGVAAKAKEFRYAIDLREGGALRTEDGTPLALDPAWSPEHLLLAALVRCSLKSLGYHARRGRIEVSEAHGSARALFARREDDGRYGATECDVELTVGLTPKPGDDELAELFAKAERDCFIGASLTAKPMYHWHVS